MGGRHMGKRPVLGRKGDPGIAALAKTVAEHISVRSNTSRKERPKGLILSRLGPADGLPTGLKLLVFKLLSLPPHHA